VVSFANLFFIGISLKIMHNMVICLHVPEPRYIATYKVRPSMVAKGFKSCTSWPHLVPKPPTIALHMPHCTTHVHDRALTNLNGKPTFTLKCMDLSSKDLP